MFYLGRIYADPSDLNAIYAKLINIANGGINLNSNTKIYGSVKAPQSTVNINNGSLLKEFK